MSFAIIQAREENFDTEIETGFYQCVERPHYDLFLRTWQMHINSGTGQHITEEQLRCLYERNPAGESVVAAVRQSGEWIGSVAAIPTKIHAPEGGVIKAFQIGDFMVDPRFQGRGLGGRLLAALTRFLKSSEIPVYTFPNHRSIPIFRKQLYSELGYIPVYVVPLLPAALASVGLLKRSSVRVLNLEEASVFADELTKPMPRPAAIVKSSEYIQWRWSLIRNVTDYRFLRIELSDGASPVMVVWRRFKYQRVPLQLIADFVSSGSDVIPLGAVAFDGVRKGAWMSVCNIVPKMRASPPLAIRVPMKQDPRQARLLVPPGDTRSSNLFANSRFVMGDWIGV